MTMLQKPTVLILGSPGQIGRFILKYLKRDTDAVHIRVTARRPEQVARFQQQGQDAVLLDLEQSGYFCCRALWGGPCLPTYRLHSGDAGPKQDLH